MAEATPTTLEYDWRILVSSANWEKGRLIDHWIKCCGKTADEFAADVGGLTGLHASRLVHTYRRFYEQRDTYSNLLWPHFCAALTWEDAEHWLQIADQEFLTVAQMRGKRWSKSPEDQKYG